MDPRPGRARGRTPGVLPLRVRVLLSGECGVGVLDGLHHLAQGVAHVADAVDGRLEAVGELGVALAELARGVLGLEVVAEERVDTLLQLADQVAVRLDAGRIVEDEKAASLRRKLGETFDVNVQLAVQTLAGLREADWTAEGLIDVLKRSAESNGIKLGDLMQPIRVVLTGTTVSEPVNELLVAVGREESLRRLRREK